MTLLTKLLLAIFICSKYPGPVFSMPQLVDIFIPPGATQPALGIGAQIPFETKKEAVKQAEELIQILEKSKYPRWLSKSFHSIMSIRTFLLRKSM